MDKKFWLLFLGVAWSIQAKEVYVFQRVTCNTNPQCYTMGPKMADAQGKVPVEYEYDEYSMQRGAENYKYRCMINARNYTMIDFYDEKNVVRVNVPAAQLGVQMQLIGVCNLSKKYTMQITTQQGISPYEYREIKTDEIKFFKQSDLAKKYDVSAVQGSNNKETGAKLASVSFQPLEREGLTLVFLDVDYKGTDILRQKPLIKNTKVSWRDGFKKFGSFLKSKKNILEMVPTSEITCALAS